MNLSRLLLTALALGGAAASARAAITGPYAPDAQTVHLWHLDETAGATAFANAVAGQNTLRGVDGAPVTNPLPSVSIAGSLGAVGFGNAVTIAAIDHGLGYDGNGNGAYNPDQSSTNFGADALSTSTLTGADGAFTLEALIKLDSYTGAVNREIISMDNSGGTTARGFQFVITADGKLRFREFGNNVTFEQQIPTSGDNAFAANTWFHTAYVYNGNGLGTLYWTLLDGSRIEASVLGTVAGLNDLPANTAPIVIGNDSRAAFGEALFGSVDEVRISSAARGATEFIFIPEPHSAALLSAGLFLLGRRARSRA